MNSYLFRIIIVLIMVVWVLGAIGVSQYGESKGHPWFPIFLASLGVGFGLPLLLVAIMPARGPNGTLSGLCTDGAASEGHRNEIERSTPPPGGRFTPYD
jgi:hypothetical protein